MSFPATTDARTHIAAQASIQTTFDKLHGISGVTVQRETEARSSPRDVVLALDRSGSMCFDTPPNGRCSDSAPLLPWSNVQNAATTFANLFVPQYDQLGLTSHATTSTLNHQLSHVFGPGSPYNTTISTLPPGGSTNIGHALYQWRCELLSARSRPDAVRVIVLLTDGIPHYYNNSSLASCGRSTS